MEETRLVADAKIHLIEAEPMPIRLPRSHPWGWAAVFVDTPEEGSFMLMVLPMEEMQACRWTPAKVGFVVREAERLLVPGARFVFPNVTAPDGLVRSIFGEGVIQQVERVTMEAFRALFGEPWQYY